MIKQLMKLAFGVFLIAGGAMADSPNLVPGKPARYSPHYWCTWYAQNYWQQRGGEIKDFNKLTNLGAQEEMSHHNIFNKKDGWAHYLRRGREDLSFLIDHGWQIREGNWDKTPGRPYFNFRCDPKDFPSYAGLEPQEQMKKFNEELQALGWRGLGIWVRGNVSLTDMETFTKWSKEAGVTYWKIDGGDTGQYIAIQAKKKLYPELIMEHAEGPGHFNTNLDQPDADEYPSTFAAGGRVAERALKNLKNTDVVRVYDVAPHLITPTTIQRINDILLQTNGDPAYTGWINSQDLPYVSMALGTSIASKRHPNHMERTLKGRDLHHQLEDDRLMQFRMNEVERLGRWSRIALPIPAGVGSYRRSGHILIDHFTHDKYSTWNKGTYGRKLYQGAPAIMARNMPLPEVEADDEGNVPYVMASTYPNGAVAIATEPRITDARKVWYPRAGVTVKIHDASKIIGITGHYGALTLEFAGPLSGVTHVWAQDLLDVKAEDIMSKVKISGNKLTIPGKLIDKTGIAAKDEGDISAPGMVIRLEGKNLPVAGDDYFPEPKRILEPKKEAKLPGLDSFKDSYGYRVKSIGAPKMALMELPKVIISGKATIAWKMKSANDSPTKNGFLVLSNDPKGSASVVAGSWIGSDKMTIFENTTKQWSGGDKNHSAQGELDCRAVLDMDARTVTLTINGITYKERFSETVPNVSYIGFATQNAETLFTKPKITFVAPVALKEPTSIDQQTLQEWSAPFRGWHYHPDHLIPAKPNINGFEDVVSIDVPTVFKLPGDKKWYMTFIGYNGKGYQSFLAESDDLVNWTNMRLAMGFGKKGEFDYGGRVLGAYLYEDYGIKSARTLKKRDGKYWSLYGSYAKQGGYELDPGYEGIASSEDGMKWNRAKDKYILSIHEPDVGEWEKDCIYQPWLVEHEGQFYNFYNAKKMPEWIEQIGLATSTDLFSWKRHADNPVIRVRPGGYDEKFCSDGKVFRDRDHWVMFYFGVGKGHAHIMAAYSLDLIHWVADPDPLYKAGGHPSGLDKQHAHKISLVWNPENETYYMFYNAVGNKGRGIGLLTSKPLPAENSPR